MTRTHCPFPEVEVGAWRPWVPPWHLSTWAVTGQVPCDLRLASLPRKSKCQEHQQVLCQPRPLSPGRPGPQGPSCRSRETLPTHLGALSPCCLPGKAGTAWGSPEISPGAPTPAPRLARQQSSLSCNGGPCRPAASTESKAGPCWSPGPTVLPERVLEVRERKVSLCAPPSAHSWSLTNGAEGVPLTAPPAASPGTCADSDGHRPQPNTPDW